MITKYCGKHGEYQSEVISNNTFGISLDTGCPYCREDLEKYYQSLKDDEHRQMIDRRIESCNIPLRFYGCTIANYRTEIDGQFTAKQLSRKYIENYKDGITSEPLFLIGYPGTGKTHLAIAALKELITAEKITGGKYTTVLKMVRDIRRSYNHYSVYSEQELIDKYINTELLILDEVGLQSGTDNEKILIHEVLNGRYENLRPTIIVSNLRYKELAIYLGERVVDRLRGKNGILIVFDWDSEREKLEPVRQEVKTVKIELMDQVEKMLREKYNYE